MKLAWFLIILGIVLIAEGTVRMVMSFFGPSSLLFVGGLTTGWLLGSFCFYKGIKRYKKYLTKKESAV